MATAGAPLARGAVVSVPDLGPSDFSRSTPAGEAVLAMVRPHVARFLALEPAVRRGDDPEVVHDTRVAARRIRTALRMYRGVVSGWADGVRAELRWAASMLGEVRDLDVQRGWLTSSFGDEDAASLRALDGPFRRRRREAHGRLVEALDSTRYERLRSQMIELARGPAPRTEEAMRPIGEIAPAVVAKRYRAMRRAARSLDSRSRSEDLHALRIRCKRARYALEFVGPLYGAPAETLVARLVALQDLLGELHDAELAADRLREIASSSDEDASRSVAFVLGRLAERSAKRARKLRRRFPEVVASTRGRPWNNVRRAIQAG